MLCSSRPVPSVVATSACVSPRVNSAEPWVRGSTPVRIVIGRTVRVSRPSMRGSPSRIWLRTIFDFHVEAGSSRTTLASAGRPRRSTQRVRARCAGSRRASASARSSLHAIGLVAARPRPARAILLDAAPSSLAGGSQSQVGLPPSSASSLIALIAACICSWPNTTAPSITSSDSSCASDSTISTACSVPATTRFSCEFSSCGLGRVEHVLAVDVAHARGADRAVERDAGERQRRRGADHRRDVGVDLRVERQHRARPPALRCRSRPGTAGGAAGRSGARSGSPSREGRPSRLKKPPGILPAA